MPTGPSVLILLGSKSDMKVADRASAILTHLQIAHEVKVCSAHRQPDQLDRTIRESEAQVFIGIAGMSAALPGVIAARTLRPVIGVPVSGAVNLDAVLSVVQMPRGVPVAAVALDGGENAGLLAAEILALADEGIRSRLEEYRRQLSAETPAAAPGEGP